MQYIVAQEYVMTLRTDQGSPSRLLSGILTDQLWGVCTDVFMLSSFDQVHQTYMNVERPEPGLSYNILFDSSHDVQYIVD